MNLITNASERWATSRARVMVKTGAENFDRAYLAEPAWTKSVREGRYVYLEVSDRDCGMDSEDPAEYLRSVLHYQVHRRGWAWPPFWVLYAAIARRHPHLQRAGCGQLFRSSSPPRKNPFPPRPESRPGPKAGEAAGQFSRRR